MNSLQTYQKKRKFSLTPEPKGKVEKTDDQSRFVVHRHQASHLHWDLRLGIAGVLKSWAIPKEPPIKAGEKRLAVQVEDHPADYINFSGIIPKGEYGAGKVKIWDQGSYRMINQEKNLLDFILSGKRMKGAYSLIHPKSFEDKNWLLIKKRETKDGR